MLEKGMMKLKTILSAALGLVATAGLVFFTACGSSANTAAPVNNVNTRSDSSLAPTPAVTNADKAAPTLPPAPNKTTSASGNAPPAQIGTGGNDLFVFTKVRSVLQSDADLKSANIIIDVKAGVVTLSGVVANAEQKVKAERLVREAEGVKSVKSSLRIGK